MAKSKEELVQEYQNFIPFVQSLEELDQGAWEAPLSPGKWSLKDVISHIMLWDQYFYEEGILKIVKAEPVTSKHLDFNEFNNNAITYAKDRTPQQLVAEFLHHRNLILQAASEMSDEEFDKEYKDGDGKKFSVRKFYRGFIPHDKHHRKQIERFIKTNTKANVKTFIKQ